MEYRRAFLLLVLGMIVVMGALPSAIQAGEGGLTNYVPAFYGDLGLAMEPPDGLSFRNDVFFFSGDIGGSLRSGEIQASVDVSLVYNYLSILYKPGFKVLGAPVAFSVTPTFGYADIEASVAVGGLSKQFNDDRAGIGDLTFGAMFYASHQNLHFSWNNYVVTPVGEYDVDQLANIGVNYWTFESDLAATYLNENTGQDYSVVAGYGYNTENDDTDYKSGDELHVDFVANQFFSETFAVGANGYYYKQIGDDSGEGALLGAFKGEGAGIGPAIYYIGKIAGKQVAFVAKWVHDYHSENRVESDYAYASFMFSL